MPGHLVPERPHLAQAAALASMLSDRYLRDETRDHIRQQRWASKVRFSCGLDRLRLFGGHDE